MFGCRLFAPKMYSRILAGLFLVSVFVFVAYRAQDIGDDDDGLRRPIFFHHQSFSTHKKTFQLKLPTTDDNTLRIAAPTLGPTVQPEQPEGTQDDVLERQREQSHLDGLELQPRQERQEQPHERGQPVAHQRAIAQEEQQPVAQQQPMDQQQQQEQQQQMLPELQAQPVIDEDLADFFQFNRTEAQSNLILIKTHKTGSTTLASIIYRYGLKRNLRFFMPRYHYIDYKVKTVEQQPANISLYHHFTPVNTSTFVNHFRRHVPLGKYITVLRDPMARSLSEYYYFWQPDAPKTPLYDLLTNKTVNLLGRMHYMHRDMGINNDQDLAYFLKEGHKLFDMFLITELIEESLVLMRRRYNWDVDDVLYVKLLDACRDGKRSWDKMPVKCGKTSDIDLPSRLLLKNATRIDQVVYDFARDRLQRILNLQPPDFWEEVEQLRAKLSQLAVDCKMSENETTWITSKESLSPIDKRRCSIFRLNDLQFEHSVIIGRGLPHVSIDLELRIVDSQIKHAALLAEQARKRQQTLAAAKSQTTFLTTIRDSLGLGTKADQKRSPSAA